MRPMAAQVVRHRIGADTSPWVAIQPGARWFNKRWPVEHYSVLVGRLATWRPDLRFAILGGKDDEELGRTIVQAAPARCLDLTGKISLPEMIEWIRQCKLMVTNDTGPMHVAAAVGTPVVGVFGPTEPYRTGPYGQLEHVLRLDLSCVPCMSSRCRHKPLMECLTNIPPDRVFSAVRQRFGACQRVPGH
jgi:lipopolysaccharide heptosyltransferase II